MKDKVYYTKIIFECIRDNWNILLNVVSKEAAFERLQWIAGAEKVVENISVKLTDEDIAELLPYINALDFEPYRDSDDSKKFMCYDAPVIKFMGVTDSYIPLYQHDIYFIGGKDARPYEKLYFYVIKKYFNF